MRTQVGIVGAGPAGLLLSHLLGLQGIETVVIERRSRHYVEHRLRAGLLEQGSVETLHEAGVGKRMAAEGLPHSGTLLRFGGRTHRLDFADLVGRGVTIYGQQEVVKDLISQRLADGGDLRFDCSGVEIGDIESTRPTITFRHNDEPYVLTCDLVVGADGFHGISRGLIPDSTVYEKVYPFSWLGVLAEVAPSSKELIYARHPNGFALHTMRSPSVTRQYLQVAPDADLADWPDDRIWQELHLRLASDDGFVLGEGPLLDKSITAMRSFVVTPMQHGRLFLAGDAAHIVPPTGAKGMNLAIADVRLLSRAVAGFLLDSREDLLAAYTEMAAHRVWRATHFSWFMTAMLHVAPGADEFDEQLAISQLDYLSSSRAAATSFAENYTGLPFENGWSYR